MNPAEIRSVRHRTRGASDGAEKTWIPRLDWFGCSPALLKSSGWSRHMGGIVTAGQDASRIIYCFDNPWRVSASASWMASQETS